MLLLLLLRRSCSHKMGVLTAWFESVFTCKLAIAKVRFLYRCQLTALSLIRDKFSHEESDFEM